MPASIRPETRRGPAGRLTAPTPYVRVRVTELRRLMRWFICFPRTYLPDMDGQVCLSRGIDPLNG
jgi:hypothetical protein